MKFKNIRVLGILGTALGTVALVFLFQNFTTTNSYIKPVGSFYVFDNFENRTRTNSIWNLTGTSCRQVPHKSTDGKYPTLGQTSRPGYCDLQYDNTTNNSFLRFITHPFDRRDALKVDLVKTVDLGKGGSETRAKTSFKFNTPLPGKSLLEGWDLAGDYYQNPNNTLRYSFDFRLFDLSILEENLAKSATIAQFHQGGQIGQKICGAYYAGSAPSPGLHVQLNPADPQKVDFILGLKLFEEDVPQGFPKDRCKMESPRSGTAPSRSICLVDVWKQTVDKSEVLRKWYSVSFIIKFAQKGRLEFFFGAEDSSDTEVAYKRRIFSNKLARLNVPTTFNDCPAQIYLGNYVLGYSELDTTIKTERTPLLGFHKASWLGLPDTATREQMIAACTTKPPAYKDPKTGKVRPWEPEKHRLCKGDQWVSPRMENLYGRFMSGSGAVNEVLPQLITDYDNFRIVQSK